MTVGGLQKQLATIPTDMRVVVYSEARRGFLGTGKGVHPAVQRQETANYGVLSDVER